MESEAKQQLVHSGIAGGHPERFKIDPELGETVLTKVTNKFEVEAYEKIFTKDVNDVRFSANATFQRFLPSYHGSFTTESGETFIKLENLLLGRPNANILDLKMGTSSITVNTPLEMYDYTN